MKKMIKFIPLVIAPALALIACANTSSVSVNESSDNVINDNAITTFKITVDFNGGMLGDLPTKQYTVRKGTLYEYYKTKLPKASDITYADHTFKYYSATRDGAEIPDTYQFNGDTTIFAVYDPVKPETTYSVTWKNHGGTTLLEETDKYHESETPTYKGETPTIDDPVPGITYEFIGWDPIPTPFEEGDPARTYTAQYKEVTSAYTVSFDTQGGSSVTAQQVNKDGKATRPATNPTKTGYDFDNWYDAATGGSIWNFDTKTITTDTTIYAHWKDGSNIHTITFYPENGGETFTKTVRNGERLASPAVPTKEGHRFDGWFATAEGGTAFNFETIFTEETLPNNALYAHWTNVTPVDKITVNFDSRGGTSVPGQTINKGTAATEPTAPSKVGYDFDGWWTEATGGSAWNFATTIDADKTLFAHWKDGSNIHTITFYPENGGETFTKTVRNGERLAAPAVPTYSGHKFGGWFTAASGGDQFDFDTKFESGTLSGNALYAHWTADPTPETKVTVTFDSRGGTSFQAQTFNKGGTATNPGTPTKLGYHFTGWHDAATGGSIWDFGTAINDNKTLYAQWDDEGNIHTVTFHPENDGNTFTKDVRNGECLVAPAVPTRDGYRFDGWFTTQTGGTTQFDFSTVFTSETTTTDLYAYWTNVTPTDKITVNFDSRGGTSVPGQTINKGTAATEPTAPTKIGYDFDGWWTEATGGSAWNFATTIDADKTLFAHWKDGSNIHTITFYPENGGETFTKTVRNGERLAAPAVPTYEGHRFDGWYTEATYTNVFDFNTEFKADTLPNNALYAKWTNVTPTTYYTVTFDTQGGSNVVSQQIASGGLVTDPGEGATTKTGSTFGGWYKEASCTNAWVFTTDTVTKDTTLYAKWTVNKFSVTFRPNGGTWVTGGDTEDKIVPNINYGDMPSPGDTLTRSGYTFTGWSPEIKPVTAVGDVYIAQWAEAPKTFYTVTFNSQGGSVVASQSIESGKLVAEPKSPTKSGKEFAGWYKEATCTNVWNFATDTVTAATILYAKWTDPVVKYHIRWMNPDMSILYEKDVNPGDIPTYGGDTPTMGPDVNHRYKFKGWSPIIYPADSDMTYFATYDYDDEINFSYTSSTYSLEGQLHLETVELYGGYISYKFDDGSVDTIRDNAYVSIDGGSLQPITYSALGDAIQILQVEDRVIITIDVRFASSSHDLSNAHSIHVEVL